MGACRETLIVSPKRESVLSRHIAHLWARRGTREGETHSPPPFQIRESTGARV